MSGQGNWFACLPVERLYPVPGGRHPASSLTRLDLDAQPAQARAWEEENRAVLETGNMRAELYRNGKTVYYRGGEKILEELSEMTFDAQFRNYRSRGGGLWKMQATFRANPEEHFYGLGHEQTDCFDLKGCCVDLRQVNTKCSMPFVYSSLGYGFLWNLPSTGRCELASNRTRWASDGARQMDYVVIGGDPRTVTGTLADLTGHAPKMPDWGWGSGSAGCATRPRKKCSPLPAGIKSWVFPWM